MSQLNRWIFVLILPSLMVGCTIGANRIQRAINDTRIWKAQYSVAPEVLLARAKVALEGEPLSLVTSMTTQSKLEALMTFPGRYEGIWPFGSRWDSRFAISVNVAPVQGSDKSEVTLTARAEERPNFYWHWQSVEEFGFAESQFNKVVRTFQSAVAKQ